MPKRRSMSASTGPANPPTPSAAARTNRTTDSTNNGATGHAEAVSNATTMPVTANATVPCGVTVDRDSPMVSRVMAAGFGDGTRLAAVRFGGAGGSGTCDMEWNETVSMSSDGLSGFSSVNLSFKIC